MNAFEWSLHWAIYAGSPLTCERYENDVLAEVQRRYRAAKAQGEIE